MALFYPKNLYRLLSNEEVPLRQDEGYINTKNKWSRDAARTGSHVTKRRPISVIYLEKRPYLDLGYRYCHIDLSRKEHTPDLSEATPSEIAEYIRRIEIYDSTVRMQEVGIFNLVEPPQLDSDLREEIATPKTKYLYRLVSREDPAEELLVSDQFYSMDRDEWLPVRNAEQKDFSPAIHIRRALPVVSSEKGRFLDAGRFLVKITPRMEPLLDQDLTEASPAEILSFQNRIWNLREDIQDKSPHPANAVCEMEMIEDLKFVEAVRLSDKTLRDQVEDFNKTWREFVDKGGLVPYDRQFPSPTKEICRPPVRDPYKDHQERLHMSGVEKRIEQVIDPLEKPALMVEIQHEDFV
jgi:hypothetical protein